MTKNITFFIVAFILTSCSVSRDIEVAKSVNGQQVIPQSIVYALPQTKISVSIEVTKTTFKKGIYAEYASKFLNMANVPNVDSESYSLSHVTIKDILEADPAQYFGITYKTYPDNLGKLLSVNNQGVILDFARAWEKSTTEILPNQVVTSPLIDPYLVEETVREKVDTFYKTIMTDSTIIKVPVYKKQSQPKTTEEFAREAANELIKTRKRRLKILRGEYDFHPDGEALKVMSTLLSKQEAHYLALFIGTKQIEKKVHSFSLVPQSDNLSKDLGYFSENKGIQESGNGLPITVQLTKEQSVTNTGIVPDKAKNQLYFRVPVQTNVLVKLKNEVIASKVIPVYQFGNIQVLPIQ